MKPCSRPACTAAVHSRGMCRTHYQIWYRANLLGAERLAMVDEVHAAMPGTLAALGVEVGRSKRMISRYVRELRDAGLSHIVGWKPPETTGANQPVHGKGPGEDVPCTLPTTVDAVRNAAYWKRIKNTEQGDRIKARALARYYENKARAKGDPLVIAVCRRPVAAPVVTQQ